MGEKNKGRTAVKFLMGVLGVALFVVLGFYVIGVMHFKDRFFKNTMINGFDVSEQTIDEVEERIAKQVRTYCLEIKERGGKTEKITADQIGYHYVSQGEVQTFLEDQNALFWPSCFWKTYTYSFDANTQYENEKLKETIDALECLDSKKVIKPQNAYIDYADGDYHVIPEVEGTLLKRERTMKLLKEAIDFAKKEVSLEDEKCYKEPEKRVDDTVLQATCNTLSKYVNTSIVYLFGNKTEGLGKEQIRSWLDFNDKGEVFISEEGIIQFVRKLAEEHDTADRPRKFRTTDGRTVTVEGGSYGWIMDQEAEIQDVLECIQTGFQGERYAQYAQTAVSFENSDLGSTYVEIDLSKQHVWMYFEGEQIVSTDCVSGTLTKDDRVTPPGTYTLYYKESPAILRGANNEYEQKVMYWMPFNGGIGLHDASWRSSFGGDIYVNNGSHGCINLPLEAAKTIYEHAYDGIPIICYY